MLAKEILRKINAQMTKPEMLAEIERAAADLEFMDAHQVGEILGVSHHTVRAHASRQGIGEKMKTDGKRIYFPSDVETLHGLVSTGDGHNPHTLAMVEKMVKVREEGATLLTIAKQFGVSESYVSQLMKKAGARRG